jgi:CRISPR-associated exonuclease Cas4
MLVFALIILILAASLLLISSRQRRTLGIPNGRVVYVDSTQWKSVEKPLYDSQLKLVGKPDYLVQQKDTLIPVEVKSNLKGEKPYSAHILQLAAYCYLVERNYNIRPLYGLLHYPNQTFEIEYSTELESKLIQTISEMRRCESNHQVVRSHQSIAKCQGCGYRDICNQALTRQVSLTP